MGYDAHGTSFALVALTLLDVHFRDIVGADPHYCMLFSVGFLIVTSTANPNSVIATTFVLYMHLPRFATAPEFVIDKFVQF